MKLCFKNRRFVVIYFFYPQKYINTYFRLIVNFSCFAKFRVYSCSIRFTIVVIKNSKVKFIFFSELRLTLLLLSLLHGTLPNYRLISLSLPFSMDSNFNPHTCYLPILLHTFIVYIILSCLVNITTMICITY